MRADPEHYADRALLRNACKLTKSELRDDPDDDDDDFEHVEAPSSNGVVDSVSDAASSLSSSVSSAVSSVGSALSGSSDDGNSPSASATEHKSRSATPAPQHKGSAFDLDTQRHGGPQAAGAGRIGPSYSGTTNHTAGPSAASLLALTMQASRTTLAAMLRRARGPAASPRLPRPRIARASRRRALASMPSCVDGP